MSKLKSDLATGPRMREWTHVGPSHGTHPFVYKANHIAQYTIPSSKPNRLWVSLMNAETANRDASHVLLRLHIRA
jgi:hypothetical protein